MEQYKNTILKVLFLNYRKQQFSPDTIKREIKSMPDDIKNVLNIQPKFRFDDNYIYGLALKQLLEQKLIIDIKNNELSEDIGKDGDKSVYKITSKGKKYIGLGNVKPIDWPLTKYIYNHDPSLEIIYENDGF